MVFNLKKTFNIGSRVKSQKEEKSVVCINYIRNSEFDVKYIVPTENKAATSDILPQESKVATSHQSNEIFMETSSSGYENNYNLEGAIPVHERISDIKLPEQIMEELHTIHEKVSDIREVEKIKPKGILKRYTTNDLKKDDEDKPALTFITDNQDDIPNIKHDKDQKGARTERRDTKALVALKKLKATQGKQNKKQPKDEVQEKIEINSREENPDVVLRRNTGVMYSSQASSIFFAEEGIQIEEPTQAKEVQITNVDDNEINSEVKTTKMSKIKKKKQEPKKISIQEDDTNSINSQTSA